MTPVVPFCSFSVETREGGLCDGPANPQASSPRIEIEGSPNNPGTKTREFVVTSIVIKTELQEKVDNEDTGVLNGYRYLYAESLWVDGSRFDTQTVNLLSPIVPFGFNLESADLMGTPIALNTRPKLELGVQEIATGGMFPHQIVATTAGDVDVNITLYCQTDVSPLKIEKVRVSGYKWPTETVKVKYIPGTN